MSFPGWGRPSGHVLPLLMLRPMTAENLLPLEGQGGKVRWDVTTPISQISQLTRNNSRYMVQDSDRIIVCVHVQWQDLHCQDLRKFSLHFLEWGLWLWAWSWVGLRWLRACHCWKVQGQRVSVTVSVTNLVSAPTQLVHVYVTTYITGKE